MSDGVYKVVELVGTSSESWEKAAAAAVERAGKSLRDLRIAEVAELDMQIKDGKISGRTLFDPAAGVILSSTVDTDADMLLNMTGMDGAAPRTMQQKLKQTNTVTLTKVEDI